MASWLFSCALVAGGALRAEEWREAPGQLLAGGVRVLLDLQEADGSWPYEGVYRVGGEIPIGYRVGGTALACQALLHAAPADDPRIQPALDRGLDLVLEALADPRMQPSRRDAYDVRVWGQACALEYLCQLARAGRCSARGEQVAQAIEALVGALLFEELEGGGWNYASRRQHASFVTAVVTQALLHARALQAPVPDGVFKRCREVLLSSRQDSGAFQYSGTLAQASSQDAWAWVPGSIGRSPLCESTLMLLGASTARAVRSSLEQFFEHWSELELRRQQPGTHAGTYGIAPYDFYFAHRYAAQAIELLPAKERPRWRERLHEVLNKTRDADGSWNDRVFPRSRNYGTAMAVLVLLGPRVPLPPADL